VREEGFYKRAALQQLYAGTTGTHAAISAGRKGCETPKHHAHKRNEHLGWGKTLKIPK
jgi:hypothetical protein